MAADITSLKKTFGTPVTGLMPSPFIAPTPGLPLGFGKVAKGKLPKGGTLLKAKKVVAKKTTKTGKVSKVIAEKKTKKQTKKSSKSVTIQKVFLFFSSDTVHYLIKLCFIGIESFS
jgi:hypothetical protein